MFKYMLMYRNVNGHNLYTVGRRDFCKQQSRPPKTHEYLYTKYYEKKYWCGVVSSLLHMYIYVYIYILLLLFHLHLHSLLAVTRWHHFVSPFTLFVTVFSFVPLPRGF